MFSSKGLKSGFSCGSRSYTRNPWFQNKLWFWFRQVKICVSFARENYYLFLPLCSCLSLKRFLDRDFIGHKTNNQRTRFLSNGLQSFFKFLIPHTNLVPYSFSRSYTTLTKLTFLQIHPFCSRIYWANSPPISNWWTTRSSFDIYSYMLNNLIIWCHIIWTKWMNRRFIQQSKLGMHAQEIKSKWRLLIS